MELTQQQLATIKAAILADPALLAAANSGQYDPIRVYFNADASPAFMVYRSSLTRHEILTGKSPTNSVFTWTGGAYITRSQGERDAFREIFNSTGAVNPALPSVQAAFNDIFSGAGGAVNRTHIFELSKRKASKVEKLLAGGTGTDAAPSTMAAEGPMSNQDVENVLVSG